MILSNSRLVRVTVLTVMVAVTFGCRQETSSFERFVPETILAQTSLVSALDAWVAKKPATEPLGQNPKIQFTDRRRATLELDRYEILGEVSADGARAFAARLFFAGSEGSVISRYLVVGIDPLWVFRQEDFETIMHWMNDMKEPGDEKR